MKQCKVYALSHPITNEIRYIGYTVESLNERLRCHIKDIDKKSLNSHKNKWLRKLKSENLLPNIILLESYDTTKEAKFNEVRLIFEYRLLGYRLTNNTDGGDGGKGYKFSKEQIQEKIKKQTGRKLKPCSEERKRKISEANKGRKLTEEQRLKMVGRKKSEEHKKKLSEANKGFKVSDSAKKLMSEARKKEWAEGKRVNLVKGIKRSEETKDKMRGVNNPFYGKTHSPEMRKLISERVKEGNAKKKLLQQSLNNKENGL